MSVESYITDCLTKEVWKDLHTYRSEYRNACVRKSKVLDKKSMDRAMAWFMLDCRVSNVRRLAGEQRGESPETKKIVNRIMHRSNIKGS